MRNLILALCIMLCISSIVNAQLRQLDKLTVEFVQADLSQLATNTLSWDLDVKDSQNNSVTTINIPYDAVTVNGTTVSVELLFPVGAFSPQWEVEYRFSVRAVAGGQVSGYSSVYSGYWIVADLNEDGIVDAQDVAIFQQCFGETQTESFCDMTGDGNVDASDQAILATKFGTSRP